MPDHVYKKIEIVGSSPNGFEEAVQNALARAKKTVRNMRWFEVTETRGWIEDGQVQRLAGDPESRLYPGRIIYPAAACECRISKIGAHRGGHVCNSLLFLGRLVQLGGAIN